MLALATSAALLGVACGSLVPEVDPAGDDGPLADSSGGGEGDEATAADRWMTCGGYVGRPCPDGLVCDITIQNACRGADLSGVCRMVPRVCGYIYQPVCGCDGITYGNDCQRLRAGAQIDHGGACSYTGQ